MSLLLALLLQATDAKSVAADVHRHFAAGEWEQVLAAYARMPEQPPKPAPGDAESWRAWDDYREDRAEAHDQVSRAYARLGRWEEALAAFRDTRWRRHSFCGNGNAQFAVERALAEGVCLERLGRSAEAVEVYVKALDYGSLTPVRRVAARIVELYSAAGELEALERRIVRMDFEFLQRIQKRVKEPETILVLMEESPAARLRWGLQAARAAASPWKSSLKAEPGELPFPELPADFKLR